VQWSKYIQKSQEQSVTNVGLHVEKAACWPQGPDNLTRGGNDVIARQVLEATAGDGNIDRPGVNR